MPAWVASLAFISANLGAQEVIGMAASGAKYGISTANFYWIGAIPAMVFVGLFMMRKRSRPPSRAAATGLLEERRRAKTTA
jgi:Sodium:solute symporter family